MNNLQTHLCFIKNSINDRVKANYYLPQSLNKNFVYTFNGFEFHTICVHWQIAINKQTVAESQHFFSNLIVQGKQRKNSFVKPFRYAHSNKDRCSLFQTRHNFRDTIHLHIITEVYKRYSLYCSFNVE